MSLKNCCTFYAIFIFIASITILKNYVIVTGTEHANEYMKDHIFELRRKIGIYGHLLRV